jgi:Kef-type K+ transport system membrane component KefB/Trk K+ transport system NAD-binding subunit
MGIFSGVDMEQRFVPLLLVVVLAFLVPVLISRFRRIPVVVGEIMAGIIVGPSVLGWVNGHEPTLELLAEIGFAFLMFLSGLEIDFSILFAASKRGRENGPSPLLLAGLSFVLTLILALAIGFGLTSAGYVRDPWMMTLILSTTSLGIVVPVLKENRMSSGRFGQTILLAALLADFLTMFLITVYVAARSTGLSLDILLIVLLFVPVVLFYQLGVRWLRIPAVRRILEELSDATAQIKVRGAFAIMVGFVVLAQVIGAELILGAFLGGVLASLLSGSGEENLRYKLDAIGFGFFVPLFFIFVGIQFDMNAFVKESSAWLLLPVLLVGSFGIKLLSSLIFRLSFSWRDTFSSGLLLSARLSLIIAASSIGLRLGAISESTNAAVILIAALTATIAPLSFNSLQAGRKEEQQRRLTLIYGSNDLAFQVARELQAHGGEICFVESEKDSAAKINEQGFEIEYNFGNLTGCIDSMPPSQIDAFLALGVNDASNLEACRAARARGIEHVITFVIEPLYLSEFKKLGVQTLTPSIHRSSLLALMARNPALFELMTSTTDDRDLRELILMNPDLHGKRLSEVRFPGDLLVLAIRRNDEVIVPHGTTRLAMGDHLTILGDLDVIQTAEEWASGW